MPKPTRREQLGVRVSPHALKALEALQAYYTSQALDASPFSPVKPFSQSDAVERVLRETAQRLKLTTGK